MKFSAADRLLSISSLVIVLSVCGRSDDFPAIYDSERDSSARPMDAQQAASRMTVPPGFSVSVYAAEPDVQNPIAMAWDDQGRMWVAENFTYAERQQRFDLSLRDRVLVFEDHNNDGIADSRHVFVDNIQMLTSVETGHGGVWLMCPPQLLFIPDANGDAVPDGPAQVVLDGFEVAQDNYHNFANGLRWGPDGWLYGRCGHSCPGRLGIPGTADADRIPIDGGIWRFHPQRKIVEVLCHGTVNPWGHDWDANGQLFFINTVIGHLWHMIPGAHMKESFGESSNPLVFDRLDMIADHYHFDTTGSWTESRDGKANDLGGGHAHIGMMIYQGRQWPQRYHNQLFTLNMHGRRANVERLERSGAGYAGRHEPDFLIAEDPFFRGIEIQTGPDGNAFIIDWSDTGECHDHTGVHRHSGRIFKISYNKTSADDQSSSTNQPATSDSVANPASFVKPACVGTTGPLSELWKQYQAGQTTPDLLRQLLRHENEHVRVWAIRLLTDFCPLDTIMGPLPGARYPIDAVSVAEFQRMASEDASGLVLLTLASTLQRLPINERSGLARPLIQRSDFANDPTYPAMIWFGLMPLAASQPDTLQGLASDCRSPQLMQRIARALSSQIDRHPQPVTRLLQAALRQDAELQLSILRGMQQAMQGFRKADKPAAWDQFVSVPAVSQHRGLVQELSLIFGDGKALDEIRQIALQRDADIKTRMVALRTFIDARPADLRSVCETLLNERILNAVAAKGLATFDDDKAGQQLIRNYRRFQPDDRPMVIDLLTSRPRYAQVLLDSLAAQGSPIAVTDLSAVHARQIRNLGSEQLNRKLTEVWGELRDSPADKLQLIENLRSQLDADRLATANLSQGRSLFRKICAQCHQLYDDGAHAGPNLTGSQRNDLDYLLSNLVDPSAVVGRDYRMQIVVLKDGRTLNGLVVTQDSRSLQLQTATDRLTILKDDIEEVQATSLSPMPEGLLANLSASQIADLFAYLMHPQQVPPASEAESKRSK